MELVSTILHNPKILFLDEATIGMDIQSKIEVLNFCMFLKRQYNTTIIYTSHDLNDVERICDKIIYLDKGEITYDGPVDRFGARKEATKVELIFNEKIDFDIVFSEYKYEKTDDYTCKFYLENDKINIFLEKVNMYSIQEMQIKKVTLEDKVLDYVDIHKNND